MSNPQEQPAQWRGKQIFIGFPPPSLGAEPVRLPVLACGAGLLALNLLGGLAADADPLNPEGVPLVARALREQLAAGKPELARLGVEVVQSIFNLEPQMSGIALYGVNRSAVELWRNAYGSGLLRLRFLLICERAAHLPDAIACDLPIARHRDGGGMLVSHKSGKKTFTQFRRLAIAQAPKGKHNPLFDKELWEAEVTYLRPHQIRLHAHEVGLRVCGESLYAQVPSFYVSELKGLKHRLPAEEPVWAGPMVHLSAIEPVNSAALPALTADERTEADAFAAAQTTPSAAGVAPTSFVEAATSPTAGVAPASLVEAVVPPADGTAPASAATPPAGASEPAPFTEYALRSWPIFAPLPRQLALASRLLFGETPGRSAK